MTVDDLIEKLSELKSAGHGSAYVTIDCSDGMAPANAISELELSNDDIFVSGKGVLRGTSVRVL